MHERECISSNRSALPCHCDLTAFLAVQTCAIHRAVSGFMMQGGDIVRGAALYSELP